jgi:drug/metabolite transporter (DMT)-like permease
MVVGVLAGIVAGALWGLSFVAPLVTPPYSPFDLTMGRYLTFGLASLAILARGKFQTLRRLSGRDWILVGLLGFAGNVGYYLTMSLAIPRAGTSVVALIIGCLPVLMGVAGNQGEQRVPTRKLMPSLLLIAAGLLVVNGSAFVDAKGLGTLGRFAAGIALTLTALALWSWYGLANDRALAQRKAVSPITWTALTGVGTLLTLMPVLLLGWLAGWSMLPSQGLAGPNALRLIVWCLILGILSSWAATWAWSVAARRLPVSLAAQLIVSETVFALIYGAVYQGKLPSLAEALGGALLICGVVVALRTFQQAYPKLQKAG